MRRRKPKSHKGFIVGRKQAVEYLRANGIEKPEATEYQTLLHAITVRFAAGAICTPGIMKLALEAALATALPDVAARKEHRRKSANRGADVARKLIDRNKRIVAAAHGMPERGRAGAIKKKLRLKISVRQINNILKSEETS